MLQRNLFYTGITRGKKLVVPGTAVRKADTARRSSLLKWRPQQGESGPP